MTNTDLVQRIMSLYEDYPTREKVEKLLEEYSIIPIEHKAIINYQTQLAYFLGAKKTDGLSSKTLANYNLYLNKFGEFVCKSAENITTNDIRLYISTISDKGLKKSSVQSVINILRSFFAWLTLEEIIIKNPMLRIKSFRIDKLAARHALTIDDLERVRNACDTYREKALIEFLYSTGCRLSEAVQIDVADVDFERRTVKVIGKGDKSRILYFSVRARLMLQEYIQNRDGGTALFTCSRAPYERLGSRSIQITLRTLGEKAGLSRRVHPHILRHTFATNSLNAGMDITVIQKILGHTSVATTQIYAETNQEHVRQQHDRFVA